MRLVTIFLMPLSLFAGSSLHVTAGPTQYITATPFAAGSNIYRWQARVSGLTVGVGIPQTSFGTLMMGGVGITGNGGTLLQWGTLGNGYNEDAWTPNPGSLDNTILGTDVLIRIQRDTAKSNCSTTTYGCYVIEVCPTIGGTCQSQTATITTLDTSWANGTLFRVQPGVDVAFIRGFSTVVPIGTPIELNDTGDVVDWEFESSSVTDSIHGWSLSGGSYSFVTTPTYPPRCDPGTQQTFRAGYPGTLDGSNSRPLDGGNTLTFSWQQASGSTSTVEWTNRNTSIATVKGMIRGPYNFTLNLVDGSGTPSNCTIHNGAVATDANDIITLPPSLNWALNLIGPGIRYGSNKNPWGWMDTTHKSQVDTQVSTGQNYYPAYFDTPDIGTVTLTNGSAAVTGIGTQFQTTLCTGTTPKLNATLVGWWNGGANRAGLVVHDCTDDTHLTLNTTWKGDTETVSYTADGVNMSFGNWQAGGNAGSPASANYYDAQVAASLTMALRSEIDSYWTAFRTFADSFWKAPQNDQGWAASLITSVSPARSAIGWPGRCASVLGLVMRALDGNTSIWTGLRRFWENDKYYGTSSGSWIGYGLGGMWDAREQGYLLMRLSLCGLYEPDATEKAACKAAIASEFTQLWKPVHDKFGDYSFPTFYGQNGTIAGTFINKTISVVNGSNTVTLDSGTWASNSFTDFGTTGTHVIFWPTTGTSNPPFNSEIEATSYMMVYASSTTATLLTRYGVATTYSGPADGSRKFGTYAQAQSVASLGWTSQPYQIMIDSGSMELAAQAMYDGNYDPTTGANYRTYALETARWVMSSGWRTSVKGLYYFAGGIDCPVGNIAEDYTICLGGGTPSSPEPSRSLAAEGSRALMFAYQNNGQPADILAAMDLVFNTNMAKPGTCVGVPCSTIDNHYQSFVEPGISYNLPNDHLSTKIAGQMWGVNPESSWPAIRAGGGTPTAARLFPISTSLAPGDTSIRFTITGPSGVVGTATCTTFPCNVTITDQVGSVNLGIEHLDGVGNVRFSSNMTVILGI